MVTLLLCKAVLGKEALPLGAAYYFKVQNTGLDHNMLLWITLQCFDKLDCLLGGSKALELDGVVIEMFYKVTEVLKKSIK